MKEKQFSRSLCWYRKHMSFWVRNIRLCMQHSWRWTLGEQMGMTKEKYTFVALHFSVKMLIYTSSFYVPNFLYLDIWIDFSLQYVLFPFVHLCLQPNPDNGSSSSSSSFGRPSGRLHSLNFWHLFKCYSKLRDMLLGRNYCNPSIYLFSCLTC